MHVYITSGVVHLDSWYFMSFLITPPRSLAAACEGFGDIYLRNEFASPEGVLKTCPVFELVQFTLLVIGNTFAHQKSTVLSHRPLQQMLSNTLLILAAATNIFTSRITQTIFPTFTQRLGLHT
jgi:hypothetical protein